jgi:hypothetical protein
MSRETGIATLDYERRVANGPLRLKVSVTSLLRLQPQLDQPADGHSRRRWP